MEIRKIFRQETEDTPTDKKRQSTFTPRYVNWLENRMEAFESANKKLQIGTKPCEHCEDYKKLQPLFLFCEGCGRALND